MLSDVFQLIAQPDIFRQGCADGVFYFRPTVAVFVGLSPVIGKLSNGKVKAIALAVSPYSRAFGLRRVLFCPIIPFFSFGHVVTAEVLYCIKCCAGLFYEVNKKFAHDFFSNAESG